MTGRFPAAATRRALTPVLVVAALGRHWRRAAAAFAGCLIVGGLLAFGTPAVFVGEALLRIERPAPVSQGLERAAPPMEAASPAAALALLGDEAFFETEVGLLRSRALAERVADTLALARDDRFLRLMGRGATLSGADAVERRRRAVIHILGERLGIAPVRGAHLASVRFSAPEPRLAADITNAFADGAIAIDSERRFAVARRAAAFIDGQLAGATRRLAASEQALADYARREGIPSLPGGAADAPGAAPSLTAASLETLNGALAQAQSERIAAEARWREARVAGLAAPEAQANPAVQQMVQERAKLAAEYRDRLAVFKPDYPQMKPIAASLEEADRQIAIEVGAIVASLGARYRAALAAEQGLRARTEALTGDLSGLRQRSIGYALLQRKAQSDRLAFDALSQRASALRVAAAEVPADITLIDPATPADRPVWPRPGLTLALAAALGLALAIVLALAADGWLASGARDD